MLVQSIYKVINMIEVISLELRLIKSNYIEGGCEVDLIRVGVK